MKVDLEQILPNFDFNYFPIFKVKIEHVSEQKNYFE